jgi:uncharacterized membrane protein
VEVSEMTFCSKCGTQVADGVKFCPSCGNNVAGTGDTQPAGYTQVNNQANYNQGNQGPSFLNTADTTAQYNQLDIANNKVMAILSYLSLLWLIPFFAAKQSPFVRYHVKQGFLVCGAQVAWSIISIILRLTIRTKVDLGWGITYYDTPGFLTAIIWLVQVCIWVFAVIGIVNAAQGKAKEVPFVGKFVSKLTFLH